MGNVFHAFDHDFELYVEESAMRRYHLVLKWYNDNSPAVLHAYSSKDEAISAARMFPKLLRTAQQKGYRLAGQYFEHPSGRSVHISFAVEPGMSQDKFMKVLLHIT